MKDESTMTPEGLYKIFIGDVTWGGIRYLNQISKYVKEDEAFVLKLNEKEYRVISGKRLTQQQFLYVLNQYEIALIEQEGLRRKINRP